MQVVVVPKIIHYQLKIFLTIYKRASSFLLSSSLRPFFFLKRRGRFSLARVWNMKYLLAVTGCKALASRKEDANRLRKVQVGDKKLTYPSSVNSFHQGFGLVGGPHCGTQEAIDVYVIHLNLSRRTIGRRPAN